MKKVIFIGLLSLSVCLSSSIAQPELHAQGQANNPPASTPKTETVTPSTPNPSSNQAVPEATPTVNTNPAAVTTTNATVKIETVTTQPTGKGNTTNTNKTPSDNDKNKVEPITNGTEHTSVRPTTVTDAHPTDDKNKVPTTTAKSIETTSNKPTDAPSKKGENVPVQARGFDTGSFVGGIILTLGLLAIGFMGFKYYKNQTERNYHTL